MLLLNYNKSFSPKSQVSLQINGNQNYTFQFSVKQISNKMHEKTFKQVFTQDNLLIAHTELLLQIIEWIVGNF